MQYGLYWSRPHTFRKIPNIVYTLAWLTSGLFLFLLFAIVYLPDNLYDTTARDRLLYTDANPSCHTHPLCYIPQKTLHVWDERNFLIVFGIPSLDIPKRRWRRHMQRITCWQFSEIATQYNNYTGAMLVLYLLARHPLNNFILSDQLVREAEQWQDMIILPMNEEKPSTSKIKDGKGHWGVRAEIGSSRKTFFWFQFALDQFPRVPYFAKGDDDMFLRVPQYLIDLRRFPRKGIYWGAFAGVMTPIDKEGKMADLKFILGFCVTLARDVAEQFVSYEPLQRLAALPYSEGLMKDFILMAMQHEDVMIGRALNLTGYPFIFIAEDSERFHADPNTPVTKNMVVTHTPTENEYYLLMNAFLLNATTTQDTVIIKRSPHFFSVWPPRRMK